MTTQLTIVSNQGELGGGEVMLLAIAQAARELGREVTVVGPAKPDDILNAARDLGFDTVAIPASSTTGYLRGLRAWDRANRRGLLWCNGLRPALATAGRPDRVVHLHQLPVGPLSHAARVARHGAVTVVPSSYLAQRVAGSRVLWNWTPAMPIRARVASGEPFVIGFLGRLSGDKGVTVLCDAMHQLQQATPGRFRLVLAGDTRFVVNEQRKLVRRSVDELGDVVQQTGWVDRGTFFDMVDLAVFPSVWGEPFGLVAAEAMAAHCPLIVSDAGALPEVVGIDYSWIARPEPSALAEAITRAATTDWTAQCDDSFARWQHHFSPDAGRQRLSALLDELDVTMETP